MQQNSDGLSQENAVSLYGNPENNHAVQGSPDVELKSMCPAGAVGEMVLLWWIMVCDGCFIGLLQNLHVQPPELFGL